MTVQIFPSVNDVGGSGTGKTITEANLADSVLYAQGANSIYSGGVLTNALLATSMATCIATISGYTVSTGGALTSTLAANNTNSVFLQLTRDGNGKVTSAQLLVNQTGTPPADSILMGTQTTNGTTVTSQTDGRRMAGNLSAVQQIGQSNPVATDRKLLQFPQGGFASPGDYGVTSNGDKIQLYTSGSNSFDACIGIGSTSNVWFKSVNGASTGGVFEWWQGNASSGFAKTITLSPGGFVLNNASGVSALQEVGYCAAGAGANNTPVNSAPSALSVGVNFKTTMSATPASISFGSSTSNTNILGGAPGSFGINKQGFRMDVSPSVAGSTYVWSGNYTTA